MDYKELKYEELIEKINGYTALSRTRELNEEETKDRENLRAEYLRRIRVNMTGTLDNVKRSGDINGGNCKKNN